MAAATQELFLIKTQQGVTATRSGEGLSPVALEVLKKFDGTRTRLDLKFQCKDGGIAESDYDSALKELMKFDFVREVDSATAVAASLARAEAERRMLQTLDFTAPDDFMPPAAVPPSPAPAAKPAAAPAAAPAKPAATAPAPKPAAVPAPAREDPAQQARRDAELRQKLVAALQPRIEEELRARLRPKLEEEIRPKLIAALRPSIEADVRRTLEKELAPRVELELKTRFAKSLLAQRAAEAAPVQPAAEAAPAQQPAEPSPFERVLGCLPAPVFHTDKAGVCAYVSPAWQTLSGYTAAEAVGQPLSAFFAAESQRAISVFLEAIAGGSAFRFEQQGLLTRKEGEPLWVEVSASLLPDENGTAAGVCGLLRDVSELRRMSDQAEADGVRLLLLVDQIDTGVLLEDADGVIQQVNEALCKLLKLEAAPFSLEGTPVSELFELVSTKVISADGYLKRVAEMREAAEDVKGDSVVMLDGRVIEQDYLAVTAGERNAGRIWLYREMPRQAPRAVASA